MRKTILSQLSSKSTFGGMEFSLTFDGSRINPQTVTDLQMAFIALLGLLLLFHGKTFKTEVTFTSEIG